MSLACVSSCAQAGLDAPEVRVEVHLSGGLPGMTIVGMPETAVRESKDRVRSALLNGGFTFPAQRITINLSPATLPKSGGRFDLPIALGILAASQQLPACALTDVVCLGELSLTGELAGIHGALPASLAAQRAGRVLILPQVNADEASLPATARVIAARDLVEVVAHLRGQRMLPVHVGTPPDAGPANAPDLAGLHGQHQARRALEVAAAGGHSLLLEGPPGAGKTLLARSLAGVLPALDLETHLLVTAMHGLAGLHRDTLRPPFRAPHHATPRGALIGHGLRPGEISLAHGGVLFLDELPEFSRPTLEALREPLEAQAITQARQGRRTTYPADCLLVAAMNPCPCGQLGQRDSHCLCTPEQRARYRARLSGPLLDRIDIRLHMTATPLQALQAAQRPESTATVAARVAQARDRQLARQQRLNSRVDGDSLLQALPADTAGFLTQAGQRLSISARGWHRTLRVARTVADLAGQDAISPAALAEALTYRPAGP